MKSARDQFVSNIARVRAIGGLVQSLSAMTTPAIDLSDLLRMELALSISALDQFIHEVVRLGMLETLQGTRPAAAKYLSFRVPLKEVRQGLDDPSSSEWLDQAVRDAHSWQSFQQPEKIADAVRLVSDINLWEIVGAALGKNAATIRSELKVIVDRRNKIVHEADVDPTNPSFRWPIDVATTDGAVSTVESIALAIYDSIA